MLNWIRRATLVAVVTALTTLGTAPKAEAALRLSLQILGAPTGAQVVLSDSGAPPGSVTFSGSLGGFTFNVTTGTSKPLLGPPDQMDLVSVNVSGGAGSIRIILEDDNFATNFGFATAGIGGTRGGSVAASAWVNSTNAVPILGPDGGPVVNPVVDAATTAGGDLVYAQTFSGGAGVQPFSGGGSANVTPGSPYSMYMQVDVTHFTNTVSSFDFHLVNSPEPGTMAVALSGLPLLFIAWRRRKRTA